MQGRVRRERNRRRAREMRVEFVDCSTSRARISSAKAPSADPSHLMGRRDLNARQPVIGIARVK